MLRGGSGKFPKPEPRDRREGKCRVCGATVQLVKVDGEWVTTVHAPFMARCVGSGATPEGSFGNEADPLPGGDSYY